MRNLLLFLFILVAACTSSETADPEQVIALAKEEVLAAEAAFDAMAQEKGIKEAFITFAAEDASLIRGNQVVVGKEAIVTYMNRPSPYTNAKLTWKPEFVDVSSSGDMGHTWGHFQYSALDSLGRTVESSGIFRTVWKKQEDGSWKFVLD